MMSKKEATAIIVNFSIMLITNALFPLAKPKK
jgi:hypothetical protein